MEIISILIIFLLGFNILLLVSPKFNILEIIGISAVLGISLLTVVMFLIDFLFQVSLNVFSVYACAGFLVVASTVYNLIKKRYHQLGSNVSVDSNIFLNNNAAFWVLLGMAGYMIYGISTKALFWPVFHPDSVDGYDFIAKATASEGHFRSSLFLEQPKFITVRSLYTPLLPLSMSYFYISGFELSKIVQPLFLISLSITLFALLRKLSDGNNLSAALGVFLLTTIPEFMAQSAMHMTNVPMAFYTCTAILSFFIWYRTDESRYFWLSALFLGLGAWARSEMIIYNLVIGVFLLIKLFRSKDNTPLFSSSNIVKTALISLPSISIYLLWNSYIKYYLEANRWRQKISLSQTEGKWDHLWDLVKQVTLSPNYYGILVYTFIGVGALCIVLFFIKKPFFNRSVYPLFFYTVAAWFIYASFYYFLATGELSGLNLYITAGYKRGIFGLFPLLIAVIVVNPLSRLLLDWLQTTLPVDTKNTN